MWAFRTTPRVYRTALCNGTASNSTRRLLPPSHTAVQADNYVSNAHRFGSVVRIVNCPLHSTPCRRYFNSNASSQSSSTASSGTSISPSSRSPLPIVVKQLYRTLLRQAQKYDRYPHLKVALLHPSIDELAAAYENAHSNAAAAVAQAFAEAMAPPAWKTVVTPEVREEGPHSHSHPSLTPPSGPIVERFHARTRGPEAPLGEKFFWTWMDRFFRRKKVDYQLSTTVTPRSEDAQQLSLATAAEKSKARSTGADSTPELASTTQNAKPVTTFVPDYYLPATPSTSLYNHVRREFRSMKRVPNSQEWNQLQNALFRVVRYLNDSEIVITEELEQQPSDTSNANADGSTIPATAAPLSNYGLAVRQLEPADSENPRVLSKVERDMLAVEELHSNQSALIGLPHDAFPLRSMFTSFEPSQFFSPVLVRPAAESLPISAEHCAEDERRRQLEQQWREDVEAKVHQIQTAFLKHSPQVEVSAASTALSPSEKPQPLKDIPVSEKTAKIVADKYVLSADPQATISNFTAAASSSSTPETTKLETLPVPYLMQKTKHISPGTFLVSHPASASNEFFQSVVLITKVDLESDTIEGVRINEPMIIDDARYEQTKKPAAAPMAEKADASTSKTEFKTLSSQRSKSSHRPSMTEEGSSNKPSNMLYLELDNMFRGIGMDGGPVEGENFEEQQRPSKEVKEATTTTASTTEESSEFVFAPPSKSSKPLIESMPLVLHRRPDWARMEKGIEAGSPRDNWVDLGAIVPPQYAWDADQQRYIEVAAPVFVGRENHWLNVLHWAKEEYLDPRWELKARSLFGNRNAMIEELLQAKMLNVQQKPEETTLEAATSPVDAEEKEATEATEDVSPFLDATVHIPTTAPYTTSTTGDLPHQHYSWDFLLYSGKFSWSISDLSHQISSGLWFPFEGTSLHVFTQTVPVEQLQRRKKRIMAIHNWVMKQQAKLERSKSRSGRSAMKKKFQPILPKPNKFKPATRASDSDSSTRRSISSSKLDMFKKLPPFKKGVKFSNLLAQQARDDDPSTNTKDEVEQGEEGSNENQEVVAKETTQEDGKEDEESKSVEEAEDEDNDDREFEELAKALRISRDVKSSKNSKKRKVAESNPFDDPDPSAEDEFDVAPFELIASPSITLQQFMERNADLQYCISANGDAAPSNAVKPPVMHTAREAKQQSLATSPITAETESSASSSVPTLTSTPPTTSDVDPDIVAQLLFPWQRVWHHAMHQLGGEARVWSYLPPTPFHKEDEDDDDGQEDDFDDEDEDVDEEEEDDYDDEDDDDDDDDGDSRR